MIKSRKTALPPILYLYVGMLTAIGGLILARLIA